MSLKASFRSEVFFLVEAGTIRKFIFLFKRSIFSNSILAGLMNMVNGTEFLVLTVVASIV